MSALGILIAPAIWLPIWGGIGVFVLRNTFKPPSKIFLNSVTGPANLVGVEKQSGGEHPHTYIDYNLHVGGKEFDADEDAGNFLTQGDVYTVYFVEDADGEVVDVLSMERR